MTLRGVSAGGKHRANRPSYGNLFLRLRNVAHGLMFSAPCFGVADADIPSRGHDGFADGVRIASRSTEIEIRQPARSARRRVRLEHRQTVCALYELHRRAPPRIHLDGRRRSSRTMKSMPLTPTRPNSSAAACASVLASSTSALSWKNSGVCSRGAGVRMFPQIGILPRRRPIRRQAAAIRRAAPLLGRGRRQRRSIRSGLR